MMDIEVLADELADRGSHPSLGLRLGKVTAVAAGPPPTVSLQLGGSTVAIPGVRYLSSYSPTVNDVVLVLKNGPDLVCLGKMAT